MKNILFISVLIAGLFACQSCQKEEPISSKENLSIGEYNKNIAEAFKADLDQLNCLKSTSLGLTETLKTEEGKALFIGHFSNLKIEIEGDEYIINEYDPLLVDELFESTLVKLSQFDSTSLKSAELLKSVSDEEIKDAMLKECGTYTEPLGQICKAAVWIAYWVR